VVFHAANESSLLLGWARRKTTHVDWWLVRNFGIIVGLHAIQICAMAMAPVGQRRRHLYFHPRQQQQPRSRRLHQHRMGHLFAAATHAQRMCGIHRWDFSPAENSSRASWMFPFSKHAALLLGPAPTFRKHALLVIQKVVLNRSQLQTFSCNLHRHLQNSNQPQLPRCSRNLLPLCNCYPQPRWLDQQRLLQPRFPSSPL
jgi:hypothetical protein